MNNQNQRRQIFQKTLEREVFRFEEWKPYISRVLAAGITSLNIFVRTTDETLDNLKIPTAPLDLLKALRQTLLDFNTKTFENSFSQPLAQNRLTSNFQFVPQFTYDQYLSGVPIDDKHNELVKALRKVSRIDFSRYGLHEHQAVFLALYCQQSTTWYGSFYSVVNRALRERDGSLFLELRPAMYILDSAFHRLTSSKTVAWRGMNTTPDLSKFQVNREVCFTQICSSSTDKDATQTFLDIAPQSGQQHKKTLFKLNMKKAISTAIFSEFAEEKEVIAGFCSKWKVLAAGTNKMEDFSFGPYHCDYFIELEQLESEPLFDRDTSLSGLLLLSKIDYSLLEKPISKENAKLIVDFIPQLDLQAQEILKERLGEHWIELERCFKDCIVNNQEAREELVNFLIGLTSLRVELESNTLTIGVEEALARCENNGIYDAETLLTPDGSDRSVDEFVCLDFTREDAIKLFVQEKHKGVLAHMYSTFKIPGNIDMPQITSRLLSKERLKHYIIIDSTAIALYDLAVIVAKAGKQCMKVPNSKFVKTLSGNMLGTNINYAIGLTDFVPTLIFVAQVGIYTTQLWHGDITVKQYTKSLSVSLVSIASGMLGTIGGCALGQAVAVLCGAVGLPALVIGLVVTFGAGVAVGLTGESLFRILIEKLFPDGEEEEINAKRKLYANALKVFNCFADSSPDKIRRSYYQLAQANHPDKCDDKKAATEKFQSIVAAYEVVKVYHQVLEESCGLLEMRVNELSVDRVKEYENRNEQKIKANTKVKRAFIVAERHVKFTCTNPGILRRWLDGDRNLSFNREEAAAAESETVLAVDAPRT